MSNLPPVVCLMGPTASGKTAYAVALAARCRVRIISVDSALVYKRMDIGTAKPDAEMQKLAPHHLIDLIEPWESYSTAKFRSDALEQIAEAQREGSLPLLVGGTMLYYRSLLEGLSELPASDPAVRSELSEEWARVGAEAMHQRLAEIDPEAAERIHPNDPQRVLRALEVWRISGVPMTVLQRQTRTPLPPYRFYNYCVCPPERSVLHQRIALRFEQMLDEGFIDEVAGLKALPQMHADLPAMRCVGYRQVWDYLDNCYDATQMRERGIAATRQLAKRQLTWLRRDDSLQWLDSTDERAMAAWLDDIARLAKQ